MKITMKPTKLTWKSVRLAERRVEGVAWPANDIVAAGVVFGDYESPLAAIRFFINGKLVAVKNITCMEGTMMIDARRAELKRMMQAMYTLWVHGLFKGLG